MGGRSRHTSQLEDKVDSLFTLLTDSQPHLRQAGAFSNHLQTVNTPSSPTGHPSPATDTYITPNQATILPTPEASTPALSARADSYPCTIWDNISEAESLEFLNDHRMNLVQEFPFVIIPPQWSPKDCAEAKPMLWKAVLTSASYKNLDRQLKMGQQLTKELCHKLLTRAEKDIDLLQALLLHLAWYHHHSVVNPQTTNLIALAKTLVANLSIHRPPYGRDQTCLPVTFNNSGGPPPQGSLAEPSQETVEEWRALAGCYYLSSLTTTCWNNPESLNYTQYLGRVCDRLEAIKFRDSDVVVARLVRLQRLATRITGSLYTEDVPSSIAMTSSRMLVHAFKEELQSFFEDIPRPLQTHRVLRLNYESTLVSLYEPSIYQQCALDKSVRIKMLSTCLHHTRETLTRLTGPSDCPISIASSYIMVSHLGYLMTVGLRLSTLHLEGWNLHEARSILKLDEIGTALTSLLQQLIDSRTTPGEKGDNRDIYLSFLRALGRKRQIYAACEVRGSDMNTRVPSSGSSKTTDVSPLPVTYDPRFDDMMLPDLDPNYWNTFFDINANKMDQDAQDGMEFPTAWST